MINNTIEIANELIAKGKKLKDPSLILMGYSLLDEQSPSQYYKCIHCGNTMEIDRPNRKKCLKCKKLGLIVVEHQKVEESVATSPKPADQPDYITSVRKDGNINNVFVDEDGIEHKYARVEQIDTDKTKVNMFVDDRSDGVDRVNESLKKYTNIVKPNTNKVHKITVECTVCGKSETIHPIHAAGDIYKCMKCLRRVNR